jgi:ATP-binding cassette subfamily B protein
MRFLGLYRRVLAQLAGERRVALTLLAANLAIAGLLFVEPILLGRVIAALASAATWATLGGLIALWAAAGLASILAGIATALASDRLAHRHRLRAMQRFYEHVLALPPAFHDATQTGRLMKTMLQGADTLFWLWLSLFRDQLSVFLALFVLLPFTLLLNWRLGLVLVLLVAVFAVLVLFVVSKTESGQRRAQHWQVELLGTAQDSLANVLVVQAFDRLAEETRRFGAVMREVIRHQFPVLTWWAIANTMTRAASTLAIIAIVVAGALLHARGEANLADIVAFIGLAGIVIARLDGAMGFLARLFAEVPGLEEHFAVLDTGGAAPDRPGARPLAPGPGAVVFENVSFAYPGAAPVLHGLTFAARPRTLTALVGASGAGKSTAMALLARFREPQAGRILIDGQDIAGVTLDSLRQRIGMVFQDSLLFDRSIRDNLLVGRPGATDADIEAAARAAEAHEFILAQPRGYDTRIGERGTVLSGGQRQRLAIARALLKDPGILILDEATAALDAATEARVATALRHLMRGRTSFVIAHRLATVRAADEILVFDQGRIVERGTYAELAAAGGSFATLAAGQLDST